MAHADQPEAQVPFALPDITDAEIEAVVQAIRTGWVSSGPEVLAFEDEFSKHVGGGVQAVAVNSATSGLHLALEACGVGPGDEVIVPTWTFTATAEVVRYVGATPVLVDVDPVTLNIGIPHVERAMSPRTKAVIPVHLAGLGVNIRSLREVVGPEVRIIEDAAHALPTVTDGLRVGGCHDSDAAVFSFYATKTITTGEGGMITTRDSAIATRARVMRLHGIDRTAFDRYRSDRPAWFYDVVAPGFKYNLTDMAAAMGRVQLSRSEGMHERRQEIAERYRQAFLGTALVPPPWAPPGDTHAWHLFIARLDPGAGIGRDEFINTMAAQGVGTSVHFIPLHRHTIWKQLPKTQDQQFPAADDEYNRVVSLPLFSSMTDAQVERVIKAASRTLS